MCSENRKTKRSYMIDTICQLNETNKPKIVHFSLTRSTNQPAILQTTKTAVSTATSTLIRSNQLYSRVKRAYMIFQSYLRPCNRGIPIQVRRRSGKGYDGKCLCPPSYYGSKCEYQSQRISLTVQFQTEMEWRTSFRIAVLLIDNEYQVHSYQRLNYLSIRDCGAKFSTYLLYKSRTKNHTNQYFVRIDAFVANTSQYRGSWLYPIQFNFLPVHRMALRIVIPMMSFENLSSSVCNYHGISTRYINTGQTFCYCHSGWRGSQCDIKYECNCSSDSFCLGSSTSCLCPLHKFGARCYLEHLICRRNSVNTSSVCLNGGLCVPSEIWAVNSATTFTCACLEGYSGDRCQYNDSRIEITFNKEFQPLPTSVFAHFITVSGSEHPKQTPMLFKIPFAQTVVIFRTPIDFHLVFIEMNHVYYLVFLQPIYQPARIIKTEINSNQRCLHIRELLDPTTVKYHALRRAKFYHKPCQEQINLHCFHDSDTLMCLCDSDRKANCLNFDYNIIYNCSGNNYCKNNAECYVDSSICPTMSMCICKDCFYGSRCQFSTKGFNPSLDVILGNHVRPHTSFSRQSITLKISFGLIILLSTVGFLSAPCSIITFRTKVLLKTGCGLYLLATSIVSLLTMIIFTLKFLFLFFIQNGMITNSWMITSNCIIMDYLLRILLNMGDWLNACVAIERFLMIKLGLKANKSKSKRVAKWIITGVVFGTVLTDLHDPIHRQLFYEKEERNWCIADYDSKPFVQYFDSFMIFFHFILPFSIQIISSLIIIILRAYTRSNAHKERFSKHLNEQFNQHYHLIIAAWLLVLLALPRLIIYFYGGCMKSAREPWLALSGYLISFMPRVLIFPIFVLPSEVYKNIWKENFRKQKKNLQSPL